ncbi:SDR family oxidoreductase [Arthrobacter sp. I2-34]|uniref:SDR family oxidoreductase n=1 Tax=Arthrobacter hankyongi TaxID=2904801 RepID=A0ABS9L2X6_9MICC|nr:SDR family oxidoreductase [Arthrobacter hankyongi]MCG2620928.1 SDR family oxidoreductase [Arthrobacter hankyongi]
MTATPAATGTESVLITGGTAGLGAEFARQLADRGASLVLVARDAARLEETAARLRTRAGVRVETLAADLLRDEGLDQVVARLADEAAPVGTLINNAGFGLRADFADSPLQDELDLLRIHVTVPVALAHTALQGMRRRGRGHIINIASMAGFTPRGSYSTAKAAMIHFSRWANLQYGPDGVTVTAVCPGYTHTEFHQRMAMETGGIPDWMWLDAPQVVREGLRDAAAGKAVSIPSRRYKALAVLARSLPPAVVGRIARRGR